MIYKPKAIELAGWTNTPMEYTVVHRSEGHGADSLGIVIAVSQGKEPCDPERFSYDGDRDVHHAIFMAAKSIETAMRLSTEKNNAESKSRAATDRAALMAIFPEAPFQIEEIPNGYCHDWCCINLPWYRVLTRIGWMTIGWRKRVINIDWTETVVRKSGDEVFPGTDFTTSGKHDKERYCHAWGYNKAIELIATILVADCPGTGKAEAQ